MIYLYGYLGIGVAVLVLLYCNRFRTKQRKPNPLRDALERTSSECKSPLRRSLDNSVESLLTHGAVLILWPVVAYIVVEDFLSTRGRSLEDEEREFAVKYDNLQERLTVQEIEAREMVEDPLGAVPNLPFGHLNTAWIRFLEGYSDSDELWSFTANWQTRWGQKELRSGYVLVQIGIPGAHFLTVWNEMSEED